MNMVWEGETITLDHLQTHFLYGVEAVRSTDQPLPVQGRHITPKKVDPPSPGPGRSPFQDRMDPVPDHNRPTLAETQKARERYAIEQALARHRGNVTRAALSLGISRQLLHYKIRKHGFERKEFQRQAP